jgi:hypothetical protein
VSGYTSGKVSHDPLPWACAHGKRADEPWKLDREDRRYDPRPEFDNHNPILVAFRKYNTANPELDTAEGWLWGIENGHNDPATPEQIDHARRVLTKLAAIA